MNKTKIGIFLSLLADGGIKFLWRTKIQTVSCC